MRDDVANQLRRALAGRDPASIGVRDVAKALDMTTTSVYRHVDSIEEVRHLLAPASVQPEREVAFTEAFVARAAGPEQIAGIVADVVGDKIEFGPLSVGPKRVNAVATARGVVGQVVGRRKSPLVVRVDVAVNLDIDVTIGRNYHRRFPAWLQVPLRFVLDPSEDLVLRARPIRPRPDEIAVSVAPAGMSLHLMRRIGRVDALLRTHARAYLDTVLATPEAQAAMTVDLGRIIDDAWRQGIVLD